MRRWLLFIFALLAFPALANVPRGLDLSGSLFGAGGIGGLLARTDATGSVFYHADGVGNITSLIDSQENIVARYLYSPFGQMLGMWGPMAQANHYRFSRKSRLLLSSTIMVCAFTMPGCNAGSRRIHWVKLGGLNLYRFVGNSPLNQIDPFGLTTVTSPDHFPGATDVNENGDFTRVINDGSDATTVLKRLTQEQLRKVEQDTADRLKNFEESWGKKDRRGEASFDTGFFKGVCKDRDYYYVEGMDRIYADNEINYLGIGMNERWLDDSKLEADIITWLWKQRYPGPIPSGTWYWLHRGYDDYPGFSGGSGGALRTSPPADRR